MYNIDIFSEELESIQDDEIRNVTRMLLEATPSYFWVVPASSSGKYHPTYALGEGGLVRHTKAAVKFANNLKVIKGFTAKECDFAVAALLLHDTQKQGDGTEGHTVFEHPELAAAFVRKNAPAWYADVVAPLVASHMGQWNTSKYSASVLPTPHTELEKFVHECDYLASRKDFDVAL